MRSPSRNRERTHETSGSGVSAQCPGSSTRSSTTSLAAPPGGRPELPDPETLIPQLQALPWFPFYPGDFVKDTMHLTNCQVGTYLLFLLHIYGSGKFLPDDDEQLCLLGRVTADKWPAMRKAVLEHYFVFTAEGWTHPKAIRVILEQTEKLQNASNRGRKAGQASARARQRQSLAQEYGFQPDTSATQVEPESNHSEPHPEPEPYSHPSPEAEAELSTKGEAPPLEEAEFDRWCKGLDKKSHRELEKLQAELKQELRGARSPSAKAEWKRRLEAVEAKLLGRPVPDAPPAPPAVPVTVSAPPTASEQPAPKDQALLNGALYLLRQGDVKRLTDEHRAALARAGVSVPLVPPKAAASSEQPG